MFYLQIEIFLFTFFYVLYKKKKLECKNFWHAALMDLRISGCLEHNSLFMQNVCLSFLLSSYDTNFVKALPHKQMERIGWTLYYKHKLERIRFWCISLKRFICCTKFLIYWTQRYRAKLRAVVPNTDYFKLIFLKFETPIYCNNRKIMSIFCISCCYNPFSHRKKIFVSREKGNFLTLVFLERMSQNTQK